MTHHVNFDEIIDCRGTHSSKWDLLATKGVTAEDGFAMWVAVTDFKSPPPVLELMQRKVDHGVFGYFGDYSDYYAASAWWLKNRHGWTISTDWIIGVCGLGNGIAMAIDTFTKPGEGIVVFSPVYHEFATKINRAERKLVECPLVNDNGHYTLDFDTYDKMMTGNEKLLLWSSPHNPGGRVWSLSELRQVAEFAERHDLILISDEVHQDLIYPGSTHIPTAIAAPAITDRLITMTAGSKTFNVAGQRTGNVIIEDADLRARYLKRVQTLDLKPNGLGLEMATVAYTQEGADWVDALMAYLDQNRKLLEDGLNAIPGVQFMPMQSTFLAWVDFTGTGMTEAEIVQRVSKDARIGAETGSDFGTGGEGFMRFNFGMPKSRIAEAVDRMQEAFADLQ